MALLPVVISIGMLGVMVLGVLWLYGKRNSSRSPFIGLLLLFCLAGYFRMAEARSPDHRFEDILGKTADIQGTIESIWEKKNSFAVRLSGCHIIKGEETASFPDLLVYLKKEAFIEENTRNILRIGMRISVRGKVEKPTKARNPGEFDYQSYYLAEGISYQMFSKGVAVAERNYSPYFDGIYRIRLLASELLGQMCEPEDLGVFQAAILGEKVELEDSVRELYQRNGIAHLLAISGLHISVVGLGAYGLLRKAGLGYGGAGLAGVVLIVSYGVLTGGSASVVRAVVMVMICMLAEYLGRSYDMLSAAALIGLLLLLESPYRLQQAGFQLSFGAVAAIGGVTPWLIDMLKPRKWLEPLAAGIAIQMVTYPVIVYHFFQYPVYGIFLNLLVVPLMVYVILSGIGGIILGMVSLRLGTAALGMGHYILAWYLWLCERWDSIPGSNLVIGRPTWWQIGGYVLVMAGMLLWLHGQPAAWRLRKWAVLVGGCVAGFFFLWQIPVQGLEVTFLDVGQGDGICIRTSNAVVLVDGGSSSHKSLGKSSMEPYLKSQGISRVDYAIVSHGDKDHTSGLEYLLEKNGEIKIDHLILPWLGRQGKEYMTLVELMEAHGGQVHWMKKGERIQAGELVITCVYHGNEARIKDKNEHSLGLYVKYGQAGMLLTGDMSSEGEAEMIRDEEMPWGKGQIQVLKAAHHGSKYSTSQDFLRWINPSLAVISCGEGNSYGHPHKETLERLWVARTKVVATTDMGAITVHTDGISVSYTGFLPEDG